MGDIRRRWLISGLTAAVALSPLAAATAFAASDAVDDSYTIDEDRNLVADGVANPGVLANDTTDGVGALCVVWFDIASLQGTFAAAADGSGLFEYHPTANFNGSTSFSYGVAARVGPDCPTTAEDTATVTITVAPVNDAPSATADFFAALADRTLNVAAPGVLGNDSDVDGDSLTAVKVNSPAHGVVTLGADGGFSYTPADGYVGPDAFTYRASDGQATSPIRVVNLTVSAIPPTPTPTPPPTPTAVPPTASPQPSPTETPLPSDSGLASPLPVETGIVASPSPSPTPSEPVAGSGGLPIFALGALGLLLALLGVGAVFFVRSQRGGDDGDGWEPDGDDGSHDGDGGDGDGGD